MNVCNVRTGIDYNQINQSYVQDVGQMKFDHSKVQQGEEKQDRNRMECLPPLNIGNSKNSSFDETLTYVAGPPTFSAFPSKNGSFESTQDCNGTEGRPLVSVLQSENSSFEFDNMWGNSKEMLGSVQDFSRSEQSVTWEGLDLSQ